MTPVGYALTARPVARPGHRVSRQRKAPLDVLAHAALVAMLAVIAGTLAIAAAPVAVGYRAVVVRGGSMSDSIPNGSLVMARWVPANQIDAGDVILVQESGDGGTAAPKIHRIVSLEHDGGNIVVRTQGDANETADPRLYVLPDRVLTPAYHLRYLGFLVAFVSTADGWLLFIAMPGTVLCLLTLHAVWFPPPKQAGASQAPVRVL